jgi:hypothetical protein
MHGANSLERELLIAAFETRRFLYLMAFLQHPEHVNKALAFAWNERICPIYHRTVEREVHGVDCFSEIYEVKEDDIDELTKYIDGRRLAAKGRGAGLGCRVL